MFIRYNNISFLFTGDAENISEAEQLEMGYNLRADVLKVGHHGSSSSSTIEYLTAVSPSYAVISCGKDNTYGHPHDNTITSIKKCAGEVYRTDECGTIVFTTDGETLTVETFDKYGIDEEKEENAVTPSTMFLYIGNKNSKIFHLPSCSSLPVESNRVYFYERAEAVNNQYQPCKKCKP